MHNDKLSFQKETISYYTDFVGTKNKLASLSYKEITTATTMRHAYSTQQNKKQPHGFDTNKESNNRKTSVHCIYLSAKQHQPSGLCRRLLPRERTSVAFAAA